MKCSRRKLVGNAIFYTGIALFFATGVFPFLWWQVVIFVSVILMFVGSLIAGREVNVGDLD